MHVVVSSSRVVFHHCIISFVVVCFGFIVVPGVSLHVFFLRAPCSFCIRCTSFLFLLFVVLFVLVLCVTRGYIGGCFFYTLDSIRVVAFLKL